MSIPHRVPAACLRVALMALALCALGACSEKKPTVPTPKAAASAGG